MPPSLLAEDAKDTILPEQGVGRAEALAELAALRQGDARWREGRTFSLVYHAGDEHTEFLQKAYGLYFSENGLNPSAFGSLRRMETEVVAMVRSLLGGDREVTGTMTSGGTESVLMAVKTYRDHARATRPALARPEMVLPVTAHPAFAKAAHYFDVTPVYVPVGPDFRVDPSAVAAALTDRTILIVGSAPAYPHGVIDPIPELSALASAAGIGLHVDACLGGLLLPFLPAIGHPVPPFDFCVPGVTSMSADLHKYGFTAKGASTVLYRDAGLRRHQFFVHDGWPGGLFGSPSMAGTRPGGAIAAAWATLRALGRQGYEALARTIMDTTRAFQQGIGQVPGLRVLGQPVMSVFAFTSLTDNILVIADALEASGWLVDRLQHPAAIHLMITPAHRDVAPAFLRDLQAAVEHARAHPEAAGQGQAAIYGMLAQLPEGAAVRELILGHMDTLFRP